MYRISISIIIISTLILSMFLFLSVELKAQGEKLNKQEKSKENNGTKENKEKKSGIQNKNNALIAISAAIAFGLAAISTAVVQSKIGSAGVGALAENPKLLGSVILLVAIPETILVFGFVIAFLLINKM